MDIIYNWDHFYPLTGEPNGKTLECWTVLRAGAAQGTSTAKIGPNRDLADIERFGRYQARPGPPSPATARTGYHSLHLGPDAPDYDLADLDAWIKWHDRTNACTRLPPLP